MTTNHTPGPWTQTIGAWGNIGADNDSRGNGSVQVASISLPSENEPAWAAEGKANARLIAAAPDMLEALREMTDLAYKLAMASPDLNPEVDRIIPKARAAIAKAEGRGA